MSAEKAQVKQKGRFEKLESNCVDYKACLDTLPLFQSTASIIPTPQVKSLLPVIAIISLLSSIRLLLVQSPQVQNPKNRI
jgi:hypothetical protein